MLHIYAIQYTNHVSFSFSMRRKLTTTTDVDSNSPTGMQPKSAITTTTPALRADEGMIYWHAKSNKDLLNYFSVKLVLLHVLIEVSQEGKRLICSM